MPDAFIDRRSALGALAAVGASLLVPSLAGAQGSPVLTRPIPSSGEALPLVGLGSWITFNVGDDTAARDACAEVVRAFFAAGGRLIDSSPMYGSSQAVIGYAIKKLGNPKALFAATKVWTSSDGPAQIEEARRLWGVPLFDLLQVHNLLSWEEHLRTLFAMKAKGQLRYVGVTTSHGRRHDELEKIMRAQPLDFIQVTYNVADREVDPRHRTQDRSYHQSPLPRRRSLPAIPRQASAGLGERHWRQELGTNHAQVHRLPSRCLMRDPGNDARRSRA
jgi:hypothetical protein